MEQACKILDCFTTSSNVSHCFSLSLENSQPGMRPPKWHCGSNHLENREKQVHVLQRWQVVKRLRLALCIWTYEAVLDWPRPPPALVTLTESSSPGRQTFPTGDDLCCRWQGLNSGLSACVAYGSTTEPEPLPRNWLKTKFSMCVCDYTSCNGKQASQI